MLNTETSVANDELQLEALLIAAGRRVTIDEIVRHFPGSSPSKTVDSLAAYWRTRGLNVETDGTSIGFRIPAAVAAHLRSEEEDGKRLTAAGMETLAVIAMHQPVTLNDIEKFRGLKLSRGIIEALTGADLIRVALRKTDSGRAAVYMTTENFISHYSLGSLADLPRPEEVEGLVNPPSDGSDAE
jgi:segregation and condensation protein B